MSERAVGGVEGAGPEVGDGVVDAAGGAGAGVGSGRTVEGGASGRASRALVAPAYVAFAAFGAFWGVWGASVPRVRLQAGVTDGQLGLALLCVGAGALPAMPLAGRALDRFGPRIAAGVIALLGVVGAVLALTARSLPDLCAGLAVVGAVSGAADVAMNAVAGRAEQLAGRPVIARAHGTFSAAVVVSGLAAGFGAARSLPLVLPFAVVASVAVAAGAAMRRAIPPGAVGERAAPRESPDPAVADGSPTPPAPSTSPVADAPSASPASPMPPAPLPPNSPPPHARSRLLPLLLLGVLGAIAFANENAQQSWSAVYAHDQLHAGAGPAAVAPAVFAATVSAARFGLGAVRALPPRAVVLGGALTAGAGSLTIAGAPDLGTALAGLVLSGAGTAVLFPTLVGLVSRNVEESRRGRATSVVGTVAYLGFLLGPVYIGAWSGVAGLRGAMAADACLSGVLFLLAVPLLRLTGYRLTAGGTARDAPART